MEKVEIFPAKEEDLEEVVELVNFTLRNTTNGHYGNVGYIIEFQGICESSLKMTLDNKIIGFHDLSAGNIDLRDLKEHRFKEDMLSYNEKSGLEGFVFVIHPDYQRKGYGSLFLEYEKSFFKGKYDYIFGACDIVLNNIEFWNKHRRVVCESLNDKKEVIGYDTLVDL